MHIYIIQSMNTSTKDLQLKNVLHKNRLNMFHITKFPFIKWKKPHFPQDIVVSDCPENRFTANIYHKGVTHVDIHLFHLLYTQGNLPIIYFLNDPSLTLFCLVDIVKHLI